MKKQPKIQIKGTCINCNQEVYGPDIEWNHPEQETAPWPIYLEGIWCKPCAKQIEIPEQPQLSGSSVFIIGSKNS